MRFVFHFILPLLLLTASLAHGGERANLPPSLGQWYKPANQRQVWLHTMFALRRELQAVEVYAEQGDQGHLEKWSKQLLEHYRKIPKMVPEWEDEVDLKLAGALEKSISDKDLTTAQRLSRKLSQNCKGCHREFRVLATLRYRSPDFGPIKIRTESGKEVAYEEQMERLSQSINQIKIASEDGSWPAARSAAQFLNLQLDQLEVSCVSCHQDKEPGERILGAATRSTLEKLNQAIAGEDEKATAKHLGSAAVQICARCHGVHRSLSDLRHLLH